jgi:hypothetical protein
MRLLVIAAALCGCPGTSQLPRDARREGPLDVGVGTERGGDLASEDRAVVDRGSSDSRVDASKAPDASKADGSGSACLTLGP